MWDESFNSGGCCPYQDTGIMLGEALTTDIAEDGCTQGILRCVLHNGFPMVELKVDNSCPKVRINDMICKAIPRVNFESTAFFSGCLCARLCAQIRF